MALRTAGRDDLEILVSRGDAPKVVLGARGVLHVTGAHKMVRREVYVQYRMLRSMSLAPAGGDGGVVDDARVAHMKQDFEGTKRNIVMHSQYDSPSLTVMVPEAKALIAAQPCIIQHINMKLQRKGRSRWVRVPVSGLLSDDLLYHERSAVVLARKLHDENRGVPLRQRATVDLRGLLLGILHRDYGSRVSALLKARTILKVSFLKASALTQIGVGNGAHIRSIDGIHLHTGQRGLVQYRTWLSTQPPNKPLRIAFMRGQGGGGDSGDNEGHDDNRSIARQLTYAAWTLWKGGRVPWQTPTYISMDAASAIRTQLFRDMPMSMGATGTTGVGNRHIKQAFATCCLVICMQDTALRRDYIPHGAPMQIPVTMYFDDAVGVSAAGFAAACTALLAVMDVVLHSNPHMFHDMKYLRDHASVSSIGDDDSSLTRQMFVAAVRALLGKKEILAKYKRAQVQLQPQFQSVVFSGASYRCLSGVRVIDSKTMKPLDASTCHRIFPGALAVLAAVRHNIDKEVQHTTSIGRELLASEMEYAFSLPLANVVHTNKITWTTQLINNVLLVIKYDVQPWSSRFAHVGLHTATETNTLMYTRHRRVGDDYAPMMEVDDNGNIVAVTVIVVADTNRDDCLDKLYTGGTTGLCGAGQGVHKFEKLMRRHYHGIRQTDVHRYLMNREDRQCGNHIHKRYEVMDKKRKGKPMSQGTRMNAKWQGDSAFFSTDEEWWPTYEAGAGIHDSMKGTRKHVYFGYVAFVDLFTKRAWVHPVAGDRTKKLTKEQENSTRNGVTQQNAADAYESAVEWCKHKYEDPVAARSNTGTEDELLTNTSTPYAPRCVQTDGGSEFLRNVFGPGDVPSAQEFDITNKRGALNGGLNLFQNALYKRGTHVHRTSFPYSSDEQAFIESWNGTYKMILKDLVLSGGTTIKQLAKSPPLQLRFMLKAGEMYNKSAHSSLPSTISMTPESLSVYLLRRHGVTRDSSASGAYTPEEIKLHIIKYRNSQARLQHRAHKNDNELQVNDHVRVQLKSGLIHVNKQATDHETAVRRKWVSYIERHKKKFGKSTDIFYTSRVYKIYASSRGNDPPASSRYFVEPTTALDYTNAGQTVPSQLALANEPIMPKHFKFMRRNLLKINLKQLSQMDKSIFGAGGGSIPPSSHDGGEKPTKGDIIKSKRVSRRTFYTKGDRVQVALPQAKHTALATVVYDIQVVQSQHVPAGALTFDESIKQPQRIEWKSVQLYEGPVSKPNNDHSDECMGRVRMSTSVKRNLDNAACDIRTQKQLRRVLKGDVCEDRNGTRRVRTAATINGMLVTVVDIAKVLGVWYDAGGSVDQWITSAFVDAYTSSIQHTLPLTDVAIINAENFGTARGKAHILNSTMTDVYASAGDTTGVPATTAARGANKVFFVMNENPGTPNAHWVCVTADKSTERFVYYNPIKDQRNAVKARRAVSDIKHWMRANQLHHDGWPTVIDLKSATQKDSHNCGVYTLRYIHHKSSSTSPFQVRPGELGEARASMACLVVAVN